MTHSLCVQPLQAPQSAGHVEQVSAGPQVPSPHVVPLAHWEPGKPVQSTRLQQSRSLQSATPSPSMSWPSEHALPEFSGVHGVPGQSAAHMQALSPASQTPLPHIALQSFGQVVLVSPASGSHVPSPHAPQPGQS